MKLMDRNYSWLRQAEKFDPSERVKACSKCAESKPLSFFHKAPGVFDGRRSVCKTCMNLYYKNREDKYKDTRRVYRENNRDKMKENNLAYRSTLHGRASNTWKTAQARAAKKGVEFCLSREWVIEKITAGKCEATGVAFDLSMKKTPNYANPMAPSIDRIDPNKGYTLENSRMVLWGYNAAKGNGTDNDVMMLVDAINKARLL